jgi:hypothetical protein
MALTRIRTDNILDREVKTQDLADAAVTFDKIAGASGGLAGDVLKTDGAGNLFWQPATGSSTALTSLTDVDVVSRPPINGDSLVYNTLTLKWEPGSRVPSSLGLNSLIDVSFAYPLVQDQFLRYSGTGWVNSKVSAAYVQGLAAVGLTGLLNSLTDVNVTGATVGQRLGFDGVQWRAYDAAEFGSIDQLTDVDTSTTAPVGGDALVWNGTTNQWEPLSVGLGASSNTYVVADITARNALSAASGDQCFVRTGTSGEWELYLWDSAWVLIATNDSAQSDANTIEAVVYFNTGSPVLLGNISANSRVTLVSIEVITIFDGTPTLTIGDAGDNARLIDDNLHDLTVVGTYNATTDYVYSSAVDTDIYAYFAFPGATQGEARVLVTYV